MLRVTLGSILALALVADVVRAAPVVFTDGDLLDASWSDLVTYSFEGSSGVTIPGGSVSAHQQSGGDPGTFREVTDNIAKAPSATTYATVYGMHFRAGATYDPASQGPVATVDYAEDAKLLVGGGDGQATGIALRQGGQIWIFQVGTTPEKAWTPKGRKAIKASDFAPLNDTGFPAVGPKPDFSAGGGPIGFGFFRGNSTGLGGSAYTIVAGIDNWSVRVNPPCATAAECDDGDGCTTDACVSGACSSTPIDCNDGDACTTDSCTAGACAHAPLDCDDGQDCTADRCVAGQCQNPPSAEFPLVEEKIRDLLALLRGRHCADAELARKLAGKLRKALAKVRAKVLLADDATKAALVERLLDKADVKITAARAILAAATQRGLVSPGCSAALGGFLDEVRQCVGGLPRS
jgi:hypothetical protein